MTKAPLAPDARWQDERTIKFTYDPCRQGHVALEVTRQQGITVERPIYGWKDGDVVEQSDIDRLKSWGVRYEVALYAGKEEIGVFRTWYYMLHDTPMVRELLSRLDRDVPRRLTDDFEALTKRAASLGCVPARFIPDANGDIHLTPMDPFDRIHFVKGK